MDDPDVITHLFLPGKGLGVGGYNRSIDVMYMEENMKCFVPRRPRQLDILADRSEEELLSRRMPMTASTTTATNNNI